MPCVSNSSDAPQRRAVDASAHPRHAWRPIAESWRRRDPTLCGRFDFAYDGSGPPKLLEYNADKPTSLFEASVVQWRWLEQLIASGCRPHDADQFNSLHERLIARWRAVAGDNFVHLACMMRNLEDRVTLAYIEDCARQAGLATKALDMGDIGLDRSTFVDRLGRAVRHLFKLYAWEWMFADPFGNSPAISTTRFVELADAEALLCRSASVTTRRASISPDDVVSSR
jgi:glutathionylspermidine synthase